MKWQGFHHPDFCAEVIGRKVTLHLLTLLDGMATILLTRGRSVFWSHGDPNRISYEAALARLRRRGLIACRRTRGHAPVLNILPKAEEHLPVEARPEKLWNRDWNGLWYVLSYDVPEAQKSYRENLRRFLKRNRMGGLHASVWITPQDIRALYSDLVEAGGLGEYAVLLESRTVLGQDARELVLRAWDFHRLDRAQEWFCQTCAEALDRIETGALSAGDLTALARDAATAYYAVMEPDPLLPRSLWPRGYLGPDTVCAFRGLLHAVANAP